MLLLVKDKYYIEMRCQALRLQLFYIFHIKNSIILLIDVIRTNDRAAVVRALISSRAF